MTLRATHALADNATPVLERAVDGLRAAGIEIVHDPTVTPDDADLLLACGLLTVVRIESGADREIVAAPRFPGERAAVYRSVVVARDAIDLAAAAAAPLAVNEYDSWSGWHGYVAWLRSVGFAPTGSHVVTGSHARSADAVRRGDARVAALDATVWRDLIDPTGLRVVATTDDWPAPPFSLSTALPATTRAAIREGLRDRDDIDPARDADYRFMLDARTAPT